MSLPDTFIGPPMDPGRIDGVIQRVNINTGIPAVPGLNRFT